jgi:hypothetical protein
MVKAAARTKEAAMRPTKAGAGQSEDSRACQEGSRQGHDGEGDRAYQGGSHETHEGSGRAERGQPAMKAINAKAAKAKAALPVKGAA